MEVSSPTASRPPRAFKARCRASGASSLCGERRTRTAALARPSAFRAVPASLAGSLSRRLQRCGGRRARTSAPLPAPTRLPSGDRALAASSSQAESGRIERLGLPRAVVSSDAQSLTGSLSRVPPVRFELTLPRAWTSCLLPVGLERHASGRPDLNWRHLRWRRSALTKLSYDHMRACPGNRTPTASVTREVCLPLSLSRRITKQACARRDSNPQHPASRAGLSTKVGVRARGAAARCRPGPPDVRDRSRSRARRHRCPPWIRTTIDASRERRPAG
jgi:hypothetical protein